MSTKLVSRNKGIMSGEKCITGTRIKVSSLRELNSMGVPATKIVEKHYPSLKIRIVRKILRSK